MTRTVQLAQPCGPTPYNFHRDRLRYVDPMLMAGSNKNLMNVGKYAKFKMFSQNHMFNPGRLCVPLNTLVQQRHLSALIWCDDGDESGVFPSSSSSSSSSSFPLIAAASSRIPFRPHFFLLFGHRKQLGARTLSMVCRRHGLVSFI